MTQDTNTTANDMVVTAIQAITETLDEIAPLILEIHEFNKKLAQVLDQLGANPMLQSMIGPMVSG